VREDDRWTVSSWIDARLEAGGEFETLDELVQAADLLVGDSYPSGPHRDDAELQYAIYPWSFKGQPDAMLDVSGEAGALDASDVGSGSLRVSGKTAEELVERAASLAEYPKLMFRWVKRVADLTDA
jgi:hypothetical protein